MDVTSFFVIFCCLAMPFSGCPCKTLLHELQYVLLHQLDSDAEKMSETRKKKFRLRGLTFVGEGCSVQQSEYI